MKLSAVRKARWLNVYVLLYTFIYTGVFISGDKYRTEHCASGSVGISNLMWTMNMNTEEVHALL